MGNTNNNGYDLLQDKEQDEYYNYIYSTSLVVVFLREQSVSWPLLNSVNTLLVVTFRLWTNLF